MQFIITSVWKKKKIQNKTTHVRADPWCLKPTPSALAEMASG